MNKNKKIRVGRIAVIALLLLTVTLALGSCMPKTQGPTLKLTDTITAIDGGNLNADQLKAVGVMLASVNQPGKYNVRDLLIAANRGYDMLAEDFKDDKSMSEKEGDADHLATGLKVIRDANGRAKDKDKISEDNFANMNEKDLQRVIENFQVKVDVQTKGGILVTIGKCLNWITHYLGFGSYIVGICIFSIIIEILMLPFAIKQQKNSIRQANLRPKEMAIRNKYKGRTDAKTQQKVTQEIQDLYAREQFNPASGCLPMLLQLPIMMALYYIVIDPLRYVLGQSTGISAALTSYYNASYAAGGLGFVGQSVSGTVEIISDGLQKFSGIENFAYFSNGGEIWSALEGLKVPNFDIFGINFGLKPSLANPVLLIVPVLTFLVYFFSMRLTRKFTYQPTQQEGADNRQVACSNTMMDVSMPAMSTFISFIVPGIIGVYWIFRSIIGTLKQFIVTKVMPLPVFTEEDYKAAAKAMQGKAPKAHKSEKAGMVRSLHHIDDEDFDDTRDRALALKAAMEEQNREEKEKKADASPFGAPEMKEEREATKAEHQGKKHKKHRKQSAAETPAVEEAPTDPATADSASTDPAPADGAETAEKNETGNSDGQNA